MILPLVDANCGVAMSVLGYWVLGYTRLRRPKLPPYQKMKCGVRAPENIAAVLNLSVSENRTLNPRTFQKQSQFDPSRAHSTQHSIIMPKERVTYFTYNEGLEAKKLHLGNLVHDYRQPNSFDPYVETAYTE